MNPAYRLTLSVAQKGESGQSLNSLGVLHADQGRFALAEPLLKKALAIGEKAFGPDNVSLALPLENLAVVYRKTNREKEAMALEKRAADIRAKAR